MSDRPGLPTLRGMLVTCAVALLAACAAPPMTQSTSVSTSTSASTSAPASGTRTSSGTRAPSSSDESAAATGSRQQSSPGTGQEQESGQQTASMPEEGTGQGGPAGQQSVSTQTGDRQASETGAHEQKSDDEILAEALQQLNRDSQAGGVTGDGAMAAQGNDAAGTGAGAAPDPGSMGKSAGPALTEAEKKQILNHELEQKFAEFDKLMMSEREAVARQSNESGGSGGGEGNGGGQGGQGGQGGDEGPQETAMSGSGAESTTSSRSSGVPGTGHSDIPVEIPADIGSPQGDDIIARQLREAAMKEQDPALREKLWNEYRKYKSGGG